MKKHLFLCTLTLALLTGCNSAYKLATSTRQDLQVKLRYTPTLVNLQVQPERITATCTNAELESLNTEKANQTVVAKALASAKADILLAPVFSTEKDEKGKRLSLTVTGYAATITSATTIPTSYYPFLDTIGISTQKVSNKITRNSVTVADIALAAKQTIKLDASDLVGLNEEAALKLATQKLLIREGADFLYQSQYSVTSQSGLTSFTLTAFPARYVNYRTITGEEARVLQPSSKPAFYFNTVADVQTVADR
ncbi:MAG: hypothetical protein IJV55_01380, partial [Paludibacteraceae bacterium]|nr:hypothetical protein [Paludibacteraceae bacterium]